LLQAQANHHDGHRRWSWDQSAGKSEHGNPPGGDRLTDKSALDAFGMRTLESTLLLAAV
jgi:hypothetical protein